MVQIGTFLKYAVCRLQCFEETSLFGHPGVTLHHLSWYLSFFAASHPTLTTQTSFLTGSTPGFPYQSLQSRHHSPQNKLIMVQYQNNSYIYVPLRRDPNKGKPGLLYLHCFSTGKSGVLGSCHVFECVVTWLGHRSSWPLLCKRSMPVQGLLSLFIQSSLCSSHCSCSPSYQMQQLQQLQQCSTIECSAAQASKIKTNMLTFRRIFYIYFSVQNYLSFVRP